MCTSGSLPTEHINNKLCLRSLLIQLTASLESCILVILQVVYQKACNYSRRAFSTRMDAVGVCSGTQKNRWLESPDLQRVGSPEDTAPWSRRRSCLLASWVVQTDASARCRRVSYPILICIADLRRHRCRFGFGAPKIRSRRERNYLPRSRHRRRCRKCTRWR